MKKLLYIGTHPSQTNGYSKIVYNHLQMLSQCKSVYTICYGIQYAKIQNHKRDLNMQNVHIHKVSESQNGFAYDEIVDFVKISTPDIIFIYNDPYVCSRYLNKIEFYDCKKYVYLDLVYENMNRFLINYIKAQAHKIFVFHKHQIVSYEFDNSCVLHHGIGNINISTKEEACNVLKMSTEYTYVLNLNRNQPRKRYDIFIKSVVHFCNEYKLTNVRFVIGTQLKGTFDLVEIFNNECKKYDIETKFSDLFVVVENPQMLNDTYVELLYNACDIGINTCDGEGWGLCNFEHMAYGAPQIVPAHDCFKEYCNSNNSILIESSWSYYVDNSRDANGGEAFVVDYKNISNAIYTYCTDTDLFNSHSLNAKNVLENFTWNKIANSFIDQLES